MNTFKKYAPLIGLAIVGVLVTAAVCGVLEVEMASLILSSIGLLYEVSKCTKNGVKKTLEAYARVRTA
jgi:hypothetical protein